MMRGKAVPQDSQDWSLENAYHDVRNPSEFVLVQRPRAELSAEHGTRPIIESRNNSACIDSCFEHLHP